MIAWYIVLHIRLIVPAAYGWFFEASAANCHSVPRGIMPDKPLLSGAYTRLLRGGVPAFFRLVAAAFKWGAPPPPPQCSVDALR